MSLIDWSTYGAQQFLGYIVNRNRVWAMRDILGTIPDYRGDHTLENYKFMNIWRELDTFSQKEITYLREQEDLKDQLLRILLGRYTLNWEVACKLHQYFNEVSVEFLRGVSDQFNGELTGDAIVFEASPGKDVLATIAAYVRAVQANLEALHDELPHMNAVNFFHYLQYRLPMLGRFRAYEVVTSLTYSNELAWTEYDLIHVGQGAVPGVEYVTRRKFDYHELPGVLIEMTGEVRAKLLEQDNFSWIPPHMQGNQKCLEDNKFTYRTMEDCLCEFRKYWEHNKDYRIHRRPRFQAPKPMAV